MSRALATILTVWANVLTFKRPNYLNQFPRRGEMFAGFLFRVCVKIWQGVSVAQYASRQDRVEKKELEYTAKRWNMCSQSVLPDGWIKERTSFAQTVENDNSLASKCRPRYHQLRRYGGATSTVLSWKDNPTDQGELLMLSRKKLDIGCREPPTSTDPNVRTTVAPLA